MKTLMPRILTFILFLILTPQTAESPDRSVAEWTLSMGGRVRPVGESRYLGDIAQLPGQSIRIEALDWVGVNADPPDLERLSALRNLR